MSSFRIAEALVVLGAVLAYGCRLLDEEACVDSRDRLCLRAHAPARSVPDTNDGAHDADDAQGVQESTEEILVGAIVNARDLGGVPLGDGALVAYGALFRGPPLAALTEAGCSELDRIGIRTIIDLRIESERASKPDDPCAQELANVVLAPLPVPYSVSPQDYSADLNTTESMIEAFRALGDEAAYPIYFHCTWGRDRTGVLAAVILLALGADRASILEEYLLSQSTVGAYPRSLEAVLDEVERRGGIDAFLAESGVPDEWVATLRAKAVSVEPEP